MASEKAVKSFGEWSRKQTKLYAYVWYNFSPDYTAGLAVVIARNLDEAKEKLRWEINQNDGFINENEWGDVQEIPIDPNKQLAFYVNGGA